MSTSQQVGRGFHRLGLLLAAIPLLVGAWWLGEFFWNVYWSARETYDKNAAAIGSFWDYYFSGFHVVLPLVGSALAIALATGFGIYGIVRAIGWAVGAGGTPISKSEPVSRSFLRLGLVLSLLACVIYTGYYAWDVFESAFESASAPPRLGGSGKVSVDFWDSGYVSASGTWIMAPDQIAQPINVSFISCVRDQSTCYEAQATIYAGYLDSHLNRFSIVRWDTSTIQFEDTSTCVKSIYVIDRATQTLSGKETRVPGTCKTLDIRGEHLSFTDGSDVGRAR